MLAQLDQIWRRTRTAALETLRRGAVPPGTFTPPGGGDGHRPRLLVQFSPMLLVLLLGGVVGDRFARVRVMVASDLVRGVLVCGLAGLALAHRLVLWHVYGASLLFGFVDAFFEPAYRAVLPQLAPATALPSANALTSLST